MFGDAAGLDVEAGVEVREVEVRALTGGEGGVVGGFADDGGGTVRGDGGVVEDGEGGRVEGRVGGGVEGRVAEGAGVIGVGGGLRQAKVV